MKPRISTKQQLACGTLLIILGVGLLAAMVSFQIDGAAGRRRLTKDLEAAADLLAQEIAAPLIAGDRRAAEEILRALNFNPRVSAAAFYSRSGELFAIFHRPPPEKNLSFNRPPGDVADPAEETLALSRPLVRGGVFLGTIHLTAHRRTKGPGSPGWPWVFSLLPVLLIACPTAWWWARHIHDGMTRPVRHLVRKLEEIAPTRNPAKNSAGTGDDVERLTEQCAEMTAAIVQRETARRRNRQLFEERQQGRIEELNRQLEERKNSEKRLRREKETAERANREKSEFLSRMTHELRTPLGTIIGFTQILGAGTPGEPLSPGQKEYLNYILLAGNHLLDLTDEALNLARIEAGKIDLSLEALDFSTVAVETLCLVHPLAESHRIRLINHIRHGNCRILADKLRLKEALLNLLSNAVKYNHEGGSVLLSSETRANGFVRISVTDTGPGIAEEQLHHVFEPFQRLGAADGAGGTGIGLTITRKLVGLMGGRIGVQSRPNEGTCFYIELPRNRTTRQPEPPVTRPAARRLTRFAAGIAAAEQCGRLRSLKLPGRYSASQ